MIFVLDEFDGKFDKVSGGGEYDEVGWDGEWDGVWDGGVVVWLWGFCEVWEGYCVGMCV